MSNHHHYEKLSVEQLLDDLAKPMFVWRMNSRNNLIGSEAKKLKAAREAEALIRQWVKEHPDAADE